MARPRYRDHRQPPGLLVTTEWVLTEVGDAFSRPGARQQFIRLLDLLRQQPDVEIVPSTSDLFRRGTENVNLSRIRA